MRDYLVWAIILACAPPALFSPYFGVLVWTWIAYFNPHRYAYGFISWGFPVALVIAIPTLAGTLFTRQRNKKLFVRESAILALLWAWFLITTVYIRYVPAFAGHVDDATLRMEQVSKILLMTMVTILLVNTKQKLRILILVIILSFGVRTLAGAVFAIRTGGEFHIWGPEYSFISDNNDFALALNMVLPMFFFLARAEKNRWLKLTLHVTMVSAVICVIFTYSRGGLLGLATVFAAIVAKSRQKTISAFLVIVGVFLVLTFTTSEWKDRMGAFLHGKRDASEWQRLNTWQAGWNFAMDYPIAGGGFEAFPDKSLFVRYTPGATLETDFKAPHSIYFQMLGEQGVVGLSLFVLLLLTSYMTARKLRKRARLHRQLDWIHPYTHMFEVSMLAYAVNGATLGRAYFDLMYQVIACVIVLKILYIHEITRLQAIPQQREEVRSDAQDLPAISEPVY